VRPCAEKESLPQDCACGDDTGTAIFRLIPWNATHCSFFFVFECSATPPQLTQLQFRLLDHLQQREQ
jgi:hypothetical protein